MPIENHSCYTEKMPLTSDPSYFNKISNFAKTNDFKVEAMLQLSFIHFPEAREARLFFSHLITYCF
jgi:hypothetical protein